WPGTAGFKLFDEGELVPVCRPELSARIHGEPDGLAQVRHLHLMSRPDAWRNWYRARGLPYVPSLGAGPRYELFTLLLAAAQAGLGIALVPQFLARQALEAGGLVAPFEQGLPVREAYYFSHPAHAEPSDALQAFEAWLRQS